MRLQNLIFPDMWMFAFPKVSQKTIIQIHQSGLPKLRVEVLKTSGIYNRHEYSMVWKLYMGGKKSGFLACQQKNVRVFCFSKEQVCSRVNKLFLSA